MFAVPYYYTADAATSSSMTRDADILIIGAGISGVGFAIQLVRQFGSRNFQIIEKSDNIGGTWWINSYSGCGCDQIPSPRRLAKTVSMPLTAFIRL
ncbi:hypothetical protein M419DRAFT_93318 [Trichoderma reesei RUT C-30]|uniref:FAD/NAD(P)-binding domain-containing protein n=1 Tax=Hypocrea jecorina (strain ATCC 56765 / BCRC 32924 / NRRL 11460 / Rut C-30) TaxID=1344414 RepID=A0A024RV93_HYPJR|nr:hypothetical protein M419DRAFT_93318 [Trichoderma reesei RUT C-30]